MYSPEYTVSRIGYYTVSPGRACLYSPRAFSGGLVCRPPWRVFGVSSDSSSTPANPIRIPDEVLMRQSDDRPQTDRTQKETLAAKARESVSLRSTLSTTMCFRPITNIVTDQRFFSSLLCDHATMYGQALYCRLYQRDNARCMTIMQSSLYYRAECCAWIDPTVFAWPNLATNCKQPKQRPPLPYYIIEAGRDARRYYLLASHGAV